RMLTADASSFRAPDGERLDPVASALASLKVDGVRLLRRDNGPSAVLPRSGCDQPSSEVRGVSPDFEGGKVLAGVERGSAIAGSLRRNSVRSRSFRKLDENNRLRRGLPEGSGNSGAGSLRARSRDALSSCQGGNCAGSASGDPAAPAGSRPNGKTCSSASCGTNRVSEPSKAP